MKITMKKYFAVIMVLIMCVSVLFGMNLSVFAADTNTVNYVYDGSYVYNWGTRETDADFLSPMAEAFYAKNDIALSELLALDGSSNIDNVASSSLYKVLYDLMATNSYTTYNDTRDLFKYTDCQNSGFETTAISSFYSGSDIGPEWDGGDTWNREHVWPNSKSNGGSNTNTRRETDIMMLRPTAEDENGSRSNTAYGEGANFYNPNSESNGTLDLRGDVARIVLYVYVRWGGDSEYNDGALDYMWGSSGVIESEAILLKWMEQDPVDTWEMGRNDSTESILGTRNVFVDYPELAFDLFNEEVPTNYTSPSGGANVEGTGGTGGSTDTNGNYYVKVASNADLTNGDYLIVYETGSVALDGGLTTSTINNAGNNIAVTIDNGKILADDTTNAAKVTINITTGTIKTAGGFYIGHTGSSNTLNANTTASTYSNTFSIDESGNAIIDASPNDEYVLMYNKASNAACFRYYKGTQQAIALYKLTTVDDTAGDGGDSGDSGDTEEPTDPTPDTPSTTTEIVFELGANGTASHYDGSGITSYTDTVSGYTLTLANLVKIYGGARDAKGNSCLKLGTGSAAASFSMSVPDEVTSVIFAVAKYKSDTSKIEINGTSYTLTKNSNNGEYDTITVDTTSTKTITFETVSGGYRCMIDSITYVIEGSSGGETPETPTYTVTAESSNINYGTATLDGNTITAKAKAGYEISGCSVDPVDAATVTDNGDGTFTVSNVTADVTVTINFTALPTYTATFEGNVENSTISKYSGGEITLPQYDGEVPDGSIFAGWLADGESETLEAGTKYPLSADVTFNPQFVTSDIDDSQATESTITFDTTDKRTTYSSEQQIWQENGIVVTNNKASSTTNIGDYHAPARFYKNSELIVSLASPSYKITKLVFNANTSAYATALANAIAEDDNYVVSTNGKVVTITFVQETVYSFEINLTEDAVRLDSIIVYTIASSGDDIPTHTVKFIENGKVISSLTAELGSTITLPSKSSLSGEVLTGWLASGQTEPLDPGSAYTVYGDVTFTAKYEVTESGGEATSYYEKVTSTADITDGKYLIVYEAGNVAFNGGLTSFDVVNNVISIEKNNNQIPVTTETTNAEFTINTTDKTIISSFGYYIGTTSTSNSLKASTSTKYTNTFSIDDSGNAVITSSSGIVLRFNASSNQNRFRYYGSGQQAIQLYKLVEVGGGSSEATGEIKGAQVSVGSDLSLNYYVSLTNVSDISNVVMKFTLDGKTTEVTCSNKNMVDGKYIFALDNVPPQAMTANITAVLLDGDNELATLNYSIKQNATNLLTAYPNDEVLKQFITDMLYYGEAAQNYTKYNTNTLATSGVEGLGTPSAATPVEADAMSLTTEDVTIGNVYFRAASVWFDTENGIIVKLNDATNATLKVNGESVTLDGLQYMISGIKATDFDTVYTFELYENGVKIQTLKYSINAYAYSKQNSSNANMANLALALYRFGQSAEAYAAQ